MNDRAFVDTNVLVYAHDVDAKAKHQADKNLLRDLWNTRSGALRVQVLQEFYVNVTRKIPRPISKRVCPAGSERLRGLVQRYNAG